MHSGLSHSICHEAIAQDNNGTISRRKLLMVIAAMMPRIFRGAIMFSTVGKFWSFARGYAQVKENADEANPSGKTTASKGADSVLRRPLYNLRLSNRVRKLLNENV